MNKEEVIPCVYYYYIHSKLKEKFSVAAVLSTKQVTDFLFEWRLPKEIRPIVLRELEMLGLLRRMNKKTVIIEDSSFALEDLRKFCKEVGMY